MLVRATTLCLIALAASTGCSVKKYAIRQVGDSLNSGASVYESDEDVDLVGEALPFSLKLVESLLAEVPDDRDLLITAARGFTLYSYGYVDYQAEVASDDDFEQAMRLRDRAVKLYLRGAGYGFRALGDLYPGFEQELRRNPTEAVRVTNPKKSARDVPLLYWTAAALGLAISNAKDDANMLARLEEVQALAERALELDPTWDEGALHEFMVVFEGSKPGGRDEEAIRRHYEQALTLSGGGAPLYVSYAEAMAVPNQDVKLFREMMDKALAVDPDADPDNRLVTLLAQRRARRLNQRIEDLFLILEEPSETR